MLLLLGRLTQREPLVLILEDLHWADRSSIDLLGFLVRNLGRAHGSILATYRSDELDLGHPLLPFLAEQERSGRSERIQLNRFDRAELVAQLRGITGAQPDAELVNLILARSDGNAFFAEELLSAGGTSSGVPDTLREVLLARVATLSEPSRDLVRLAAAGGTQVSPRLLADVSGRDERELEASLREAVRSTSSCPWTAKAATGINFVTPSCRRPCTASFCRPNGLGSTLGSPAPLPDRETDAMRRSRPSWPTTGRPRTTCLERSTAGSRRASQLEAIYAFAKAQANFEHALALWDQVPDAASRAPFDRVDLLMRAAFLAEGCGPIALSRRTSESRSAWSTQSPIPRALGCSMNGSACTPTRCQGRRSRCRRTRRPSGSCPPSHRQPRARWFSLRSDATTRSRNDSTRRWNSARRR